MKISPRFSTPLSAMSVHKQIVCLSLRRAANFGVGMAANKYVEITKRTRMKPAALVS
jgi:hypothetical protein